MGSNVGAYAIIPFGAVATNYNLAYAPGVLAINPAALTYVAAPAARLYGATNPIFNGTITGFVNGDTEANATSGTLTFLSPSVAASYVGAYAINGSGLSANHGNYVFVQTPGNATALTITPATLAYAATPVSRLYGAANGVFGGTVIGFVNGDTQAAATSGSLAFTSPGLAASNVGSYPITGAGLTANHGNYVFIQTAGNRTALTINPAPLTITANSGTRVYGTPTPDFGVTYDGLVNGDTSAVVSGLTVGANTALTSKVSIYPIVPANAVAENYVIDFVNGVLVVTSPPVEIDGSQYLAATLNGDPLMTPYYVVVDIEDRDELFAIDDSVGTGPSVGDSVDAALADSTNSANFQSGWAAPSFDPDAPLDNALNEAGELFSWAKYRGEYLRSYRLPVGRDRQGFGPCWPGVPATTPGPRRGSGRRLRRSPSCDAIRSTSVWGFHPMVSRTGHLYSPQAIVTCLKKTPLLVFALTALGAAAFGQLAPFQPLTPTPLGDPNRPVVLPLVPIAPPTVAAASDEVLLPSLLGLAFLGDRAELRPEGVTRQGVDATAVPLLRGEDFRRIAARYLGQPVTLERLNQLTHDLVVFFRAHGRPIVDVLVPEQDISRGTVQVLVLEGRLGRVKVIGNAHFSPR